MKKNMNENFEITVDEMTEIFGDTPVEMSFREVKEGMDSFFGLMGLTVELVNLIRKEDELKKHHRAYCALPGFVDSKNEEKTERNAGYLVVSHSGGGMLRQGTRKGIRRTPANRGMRAHRIVKSLDISEDVCHGLCP